MTQLDLVREEALRRGVPIALDSSALIAFLVKEQPITSIVAQLTLGPTKVLLSAIVVSEALVRTARTEDRSFLESIVTSLHVAPTFQVVPFDVHHIVETCIVRAETRLKFPDSAIIATARMAGAIAIVGNDRAWQNRPLGIRYIHLDDVVREQEEDAR